MISTPGITDRSESSPLSRGTCFAAVVIDELFESEGLEGEDLAQVIADYCGMSQMEHGTHHSLSGYDLDVWTYDTSTVERLSVFENRELLLERLPAVR